MSDQTSASETPTEESSPKRRRYGSRRTRRAILAVAVLVASVAVTAIVAPGYLAQAAWHATNPSEVTVGDVSIEVPGSWYVIESTDTSVTFVSGRRGENVVTYTATEIAPSLADLYSIYRSRYRDLKVTDLGGNDALVFQEGGAITYVMPDADAILLVPVGVDASDLIDAIWG